jgi:hypothetical protein
MEHLKGEADLLEVVGEALLEQSELQGNGDGVSDAVASDKALEGALVRDRGLSRVPGRGLPVGAVLLRHKVDTGMTAVFLDVSPVLQSFTA